MDGWLLLGGVYSNRKEISRAVAAYEKALSINPDQEGRPHAAGHPVSGGPAGPRRPSRCSPPLVKKQPDLVPALYYLGQAQMRLKRYSAAEKSFQAALKFSPHLQGAPSSSWPASTSCSATWPGPRPCTLAILRHNPESTLAHERLGRLYLRSGRYQEALNQFAILKGLSREDLEVRIKIGLVFLQQKRYGQAADEFRAILELDPKKHRARYYLGLALQELGKQHQALEVLEEVPPSSEFYVESRLLQAEILLDLNQPAGGAAGAGEHPQAIPPRG